MIMTKEPEVIAEGIEYMRVLALSFLIFAVSNMLFNVLRVVENVRLGTFVSLCTLVINISLNYCLIFGNFGFPRLGSRGAAVATVLSQAVSFLILLSQYVRGRSSLRLSIRNFTLRLKMYGEILKIGAPSFFRQGLVSVSMILLNRFAGPYGDPAIAGLSLVSRIMMFVIMALIGFGQGFQPVAGYNWGAKRYGRLWQAFWFSIKVGTATLALVGLGVFIFADDIIAIFRPDDARVIEIGALSLRYQCAVLPLQVSIIVSNMLFQSIGMGGKAAVLALARQGLFFIPAIVVLSGLFGLPGIQMSQPAADIMTFLIAVPLTATFLRWLRGVKDTLPPPADCQPALEEATLTE